MSGWQQYYEHIDGMTDEEMLAEERRHELLLAIEAQCKKIEHLLHQSGYQIHLAEARWHEHIDQLEELAQAVPEGQLSYLRIAWQEWDTGIRTGPTTLHLADLLVGQQQDQKLAPLHQPVPSQNSRRA